MIGSNNDIKKNLSLYIIQFFMFFMFMDNVVELMHPKLLVRLKCEFEDENIKRRSGDTFLNLQHFQSRRTCWSFEMGTRMSDKCVNYSHKPAQTK